MKKPKKSRTQPFRFALIRSRFNPEVTEGLERGSHEILAEHGIKIADKDVFLAPGAFEIPLLAQELARTGRYDGVICLGCVIKGDTAHFEFISGSTAYGLMQAGLETRTPIAFGILTTYTDEQANLRSRPDAHNKGREAAGACLELAESLRQIKKPR